MEAFLYHPCARLAHFNSVGGWKGGGGSIINYLNQHETKGPLEVLLIYKYWAAVGGRGVSVALKKSWYYVPHNNVNCCRIPFETL